MNASRAFFLVATFFATTVLIARGGAGSAENQRTSKFTISKQTTYVTEPLDREGYAAG
jgi:hypothetical protein